MMLGLEHAIIVVKIFLIFLLGEIPKLVQVSNAKRIIKEKQQTIADKRRIFMDTMRSLGSASKAVNAAHNHHVAFDLHGTANDPTTTTGPATKLSHETNGALGFDPLTIAGLIFLPPTLQHFGVSVWVYIPISCICLYFWQVKS